LKPVSEAHQQKPASEAADALAQEIQRRRQLAAQKAEAQSGKAYGGAQSGRIMITEPQPGSADMLRIRLTSELGGSHTGKFEIIGYARDGLEAAQMATQMVPDVILIHESLPGMNGYEACEMISLAAPNVATVLLVDPTRLSQPEVARRALRAGARGVLSADPSTEALLETLHDLIALQERRKQPEYELITDPMKMPVTFAVTGAKGGIGKTTVATNLAVSFARRFPNEVLLVDFYGQYGNVSLMLNLSPDGTIRDLANFARSRMVPSATWRTSPMSWISASSRPTSASMKPPRSACWRAAARWWTSRSWSCPPMARSPSWLTWWGCCAATTALCSSTCRP